MASRKSKALSVTRPSGTAATVSAQQLDIALKHIFQILLLNLDAAILLFGEAFSRLGGQHHKCFDRLLDVGSISIVLHRLRPCAVALKIAIRGHPIFRALIVDEHDLFVEAVLRNKSAAVNALRNFAFTVPQG